MGCDGCELWTENCRSCYAGVQHYTFGTARRGYSPTFKQVTFWPGRMTAAAKLPDLRGRYRIQRPWLNSHPRLIFVSDMSDALSNAVSFDYLRMEIIENVISQHGRRHNWCWLTKRPGRMAEFSDWLKQQDIGWPINLWAGTSVTTATTTTRIDDLLKVGDKNTLHFLSVEPQWESIDLRPWLPKLDWVIQGGESGKQAKRFQLEWAREMRKHCADARVAYFLKQLGACALDGEKRVELKARHGDNWHEWPEDLRVRKMPTKADN